MEKKEDKKESVTKTSAKSVAPKAQIKEKPELKVVKKDDKKAKAKKVVSEVKASARYVRIAPRKLRLVIDQLRALDADQAVNNLKFINKGAAKAIAKILNAAIANAENNFQLDKKDLFIKTFTANDGPTLKRYKPRAHGRSFQIRKRTSHVDLVLGVKEGAKLKDNLKKVAKQEDVKVVSPSEIKQDGKDSSKGPDRSNNQKGGDGKGFMKGVFQRKTG